MKTLTHEELVEKARKWLEKPYASCLRDHGHGGCSVVITELEAANKTGEIPDAIGFQGCRSNYTVLVECKTSYSDFLADQKKVFRSPLIPEDGLGMQRWYLAEPGVIPVEKLPEKWGLLEVSAGGIKVVKRCVPFEKRNTEGEMSLLISAICRLHVTDPENCVNVKYYSGLNSRGEKTACVKRATVTAGKSDTETEDE